MAFTPSLSTPYPSATTPIPTLYTYQYTPSLLSTLLVTYIGRAVLSTAMATPPEHDPKPASHINPPTKWSVDELIAWIEQDQNIPFDEDERAKLRAARVTGLAFLSCDGDWRFFRDCGLSHGTAMVLAKLSMEPTKEESKLLSCHVIHAT